MGFLSFLNPVSLGASIIGGIQGASAAHNAANALKEGYAQAGETVVNATDLQNPLILRTASEQANNVLTAGTLAGQHVVDAATTAGNQVVDTATTAGNQVVDAAGRAIQGVSPYTAAGAESANLLAAGLAPGGDLNRTFTARDMVDFDPGYAFRMAQGQKALERSAASRGLIGAGGTAKALARYAQDYSSGEYTNAFNRLQSDTQNRFARLYGTAGLGERASEWAGNIGTSAAEWKGANDTAASEWKGQADLGASEYAGNADISTNEWAGAQNIAARNLTARNAIESRNYLANTQIDAAKAQAQGDLGAAASWNDMLSGIAGSVGPFGGGPKANYPTWTPPSDYQAAGGGWTIGNASDIPNIAYNPPIQSPWDIPLPALPNA